MKKILIGCFACLVAFFGVLFSVGSSNTKLNFLVDNSISRAASYENDIISFYLDSSVLYFGDLELNIGTINSSSSLYYFNTNNEKLFGFDLSSFEGDSFKFSSTEDYNYFLFGEEGTFISRLTSDISAIGVSKDIWYFLEPSSGSPVAHVINGFSIEGITLLDSISNINSSLEPYIGSYLPDISDPDLPPSSPSNNPLNDISSTINGVIDWFVDLFNGLSDIFIVTDINGNFIGFSLWGNILFIEVSVGLVIIVLRWVISLIKGI